MRKPWALKSGFNFTVTLLGISGISLYVYNLYKQEKFNNPIISESVKIINRNEKIKDLIGYPISYLPSTKNKYNQTEQQTYFGFDVSGPRGKVSVELTASKLILSQIGKELPIEEEKYKKIVAELEDCQKKIKNNKKNEQVAQLKIKQTEVQAQKLKYQQELRKSQIQAQRYYIPNAQLYNKLLKNNEIDQIPQNTQLWSIDQLSVELPNKAKLNIIDSSINKNINNKLQLPNSESIKKKIAPPQLILSEQALQQYSKRKTSFMYQKYGTYRMLTSLITLMAAALVIIYIANNRVKSLVGTLLITRAQSFFLQNQKLRKVMAEKGIKQLKWNKNIIGGGIKGNKFEAMIDVEGIRGGKVLLAGNYFAKQQDYYIHKFELHYKSKDGQVQILNLIG